mgnify:CR=1 FL=1
MPAVAKCASHAKSEFNLANVLSWLDTSKNYVETGWMVLNDVENYGKIILWDMKMKLLYKIY